MDEKTISTLRDGLMRRYPGVIVDVSFIDHTKYHVPGSYQAWHLCFVARSPQLLIDHGLAASTSSFQDLGFHDARRKSSCEGNSEFAGCSWYGRATGRIDDNKYAIGFHIEERSSDSPHRLDRALTKKMETQVMRLLKPFIRGTWKPQAA